MRRFKRATSWPRLTRPVTLGLLLSCILLGTTGVDCDADAEAAFRSEATSAIGQGIGTILNGVIDGFVAAVETAGDGTSSASSSSGTSSSSDSSGTSSSN